jgi:DNA-binding IscR family transcriptional regulator
MILRQTEGSFLLMPNEDLDGTGREIVLSRIWKEMGDAIDRVVDNITLQDMMDWQLEQVSQYVI